MKVEIVTIGDELLLGFTVDTNAAWMGRELASIGVEIVRRATVGDSPEAIAEAVSESLNRTGAVITTGGLGPTADDRTKAVVARLFGRALLLDDSLASALRERWARLKRTGPFPESNITQAIVPEGAIVLSNRNGTAPGLWLEDDRGRWVIMLPGVPREMRALVSEEVMPRLRDRLKRSGTLPVIMSRTLRTTGVAESALFDQLGELGLSVDGLDVAFLPGVDGVDLRLTARGLPAEEASALLAGAMLKIHARAGRCVYGEGSADIAEIVLQAARRRGMKIAVAESCTGGMLGTRLTAIPGSSDVFLGGVIAYDNAVKRNLLGVSEADLAQHGAVSEEVSLAMARGIRRRLDADIAIGITGVAGPGGGTAAKPVGMVWVALDGVATGAHALRLFGSREEVRERASQAALDLVRRALD